MVTDLLEAQLAELRATVKTLEEDRTRLALETTRWQTRYEELTKWLEQGGSKLGSSAPPSASELSGWADADPFAEVPEEKARLTRLFLEDPGTVMAEAAGDGMASDFAADGTLESAG